MGMLIQAVNFESGRAFGRQMRSMVVMSGQFQIHPSGAAIGRFILKSQIGQLNLTFHHGNAVSSRDFRLDSGVLQRR
jgi:hypothetical protein